MHTYYRNSTDRRASILVRALGPRGEGTDVRTCCSVDVLTDAASVCPPVYNPSESGDAGPIDARDEGEEPRLPDIPLPRSTDPEIDPDPLPFACFPLLRPSPNTPAIPLPPVAPFPPLPTPAPTLPPPCRSTSAGYGNPSGVRAIGCTSTLRSVISVAEVLSARIGN
jgi:hypothetical protein